MTVKQTRQISLTELAEYLGATIKGDASLVIDQLAAIDKASKGALCFVYQSKYLKQLQDTKASAVLISQPHLEKCAARDDLTYLVVEDAYYAYAQATKLFASKEHLPLGSKHPSAVVASTAEVHASAHLGANVCIAEHVHIGADAIIEAGTVVCDSAQIGAGTHIKPNVTVGERVILGARCLIHSGVVIGSDGFGFAPKQGQWLKIEHLGSVVIGDDVEIGANTTIDRGVQGNTEIGNGVIIDNQVQVAHNVVLGDYTAVAGCVGIAGSAIIGKHCQIGGSAGIAGHITIADGTVITGMSMVTKSIAAPGIYSSGFPAKPRDVWKKAVAKFHLQASDSDKS